MRYEPFRYVMNGNSYLGVKEDLESDVYRRNVDGEMVLYASKGGRFILGQFFEVQRNRNEFYILVGDD